MKTYSGSGIIPIIKDKNNNYYLVLFKSTIRKHISNILIEEAGGCYEGGNIKLSAIRELKEESSLLFNLEQFTSESQIKTLYKTMMTHNVEIKLLDNTYYISYFVYLDDNFDLFELRKDYINNMRNFWKGGFSVYTENRDIIFIPINNLKYTNNIYIKDHLEKEYMLFDRTFNIFSKLVESHSISKFLKSITKYPIKINKIILNTFTYKDKKEKHVVNNLIVYK